MQGYSESIASDRGGPNKVLRTKKIDWKVCKENLRW